VTPLRARWCSLRRAIRQALCHHDWMMEPAPPQGETLPATIRQRCPWCAKTRPGIVRESPRYTYREGMARADGRFILHNPRLGKKCVCIGCETRRRERRSKRPLPMRKSA
jgi:hypothetical protein